jgi:hypothetical protein
MELFLSLPAFTSVGCIGLFYLSIDRSRCKCPNDGVLLGTISSAPTADLDYTFLLEHSLSDEYGRVNLHDGEEQKHYMLVSIT